MIITSKFSAAIIPDRSQGVFWAIPTGILSITCDLLLPQLFNSLIKQGNDYRLIMNKSNRNEDSLEDIDLEKKEEAQRLVKFQIEQIRHTENRAERILRIFIATIGISVTGLYVIISGSELSVEDVLSFRPFAPSSVNSLSNEIAGIVIIREPQAELIVLLLIAFLSLLFTLSIGLLFVHGTINAWKVIEPKEIYPSRMTLSDFDDLTDYVYIIEKNGEILDQKEEGLTNILRVISMSVLIFIGSLIVYFLSFVLLIGEGAVFGFLVILVAGGYKVNKEISADDIIHFLKPRLMPELGAIALSGSLYYRLISINDAFMGSVVFIVASIFLALSLYALQNTTSEEHGRYAVRSLVIPISTIPIVFLLEIGTSDPFFGKEPVVFDIIFSGVLGYLVFGIVIGIQYIVREGVGKFIDEWVTMDQNGAIAKLKRKITEITNKAETESREN